MLQHSRRRGLAALRLPALTGHARLPGAVVGCAVAALGIAVHLHAGLGVGPYDVLNSGLANRLGITFGTASVMVSIAFGITGWRLGARIGAGTLAAMLLIGPMVDGWLWLLPAPSALAARVALLLAGLVVVAVGLSLIVAAGRGGGPVEVLMLGLSGRGVPLRWVRTAMEVTMCATGYLLGGQLGIGTLLIALMIGHLIAVFVPAEAGR